MTVGHVNVKETIERIQKEISNDKSISPILISSIELLIVVIQMLFDRQTMNSSNSSLPPTSDNKRRSRGKDKKKRRQKGENNVGGQEGHSGSTLTQYEEVDEIIKIPIDRRSLPIGEKFTKSDPETRQVIDLNIEFVVREYQAEVLIGADGIRFVAPFPEHITKAIQYGPSVKSFAVYMSQYQLIPYGRVQEVFKDQFDLRISQGTLCNFNREAYEKLEDFESNLIMKLKVEKVLNADETGIKIDGELAWAHVLCTPQFTFIYPHEKRGRDAMIEMGIIPEYKEILIHDHWKPYLGYDCKHGLCNAHHLRELQWVIDFKKQKWATKLMKFLIKLNVEVDEYGGVLPLDIQTKRIKRYREIIKSGNPECPVIVPALGSGKKKEKQTKERNLLNRLRDFEDQVLLFMKIKEAPFTNNQAERDIRMLKVQQKVSGQFKSMKSARYFCRIRSYLMTSKKTGNSPYDKLNNLFFSES
jgi:transposase